ncbi:MAG: hypothetical protein HOP15_07140 [Planctomycetes bacterium]|nr:hypothetical protein [Planctomycetota bacterium]
MFERSQLHAFLVKGALTATTVALAAHASHGAGLTQRHSTSNGAPLEKGAEFELLSISVPEGAVWQINREIVFLFSEAVDFSSVGLNTISIQSSGGMPATGSFFLRHPFTLVFQPTCPTRDDFSDAGLQPGGVSYMIRVVGRDSGATNTVRSLDGDFLEHTHVRHFSTPASSQPAIVFFDRVPGPPRPVLRHQVIRHSTDDDATHLEVGGDPNRRVYFELDADLEPVLSVPGFRAPLNLYGEPSSAVAVVIAFNQPVNPSTSNISENRLRLEFLDCTGTWRALDTRVTLAANCTEIGARVRLEPIGVLPSASELRAVVQPGFQDLVGQANLVSIDEFARVPTTTVEFTSLAPADVLSDELREDFDFGGDGPASLQDTGALFDSPQAEWGNGVLSAAFSFEGTGGPNGDFDWVVRTGQFFIFDTVATPIVGGPGGIPTTTQMAVNGVVDVRHLTIEAGGEIRVQGPNPMRIHATGDVRIEGKLNLSGFNAKDVATLNTGNQVELGAAGVAGGGRGGNANEVITNSTPRGGRGRGPFGQPNAGGQGGETGYAPANLGKNARRPGGGGGGRFARDIASGSTPAGFSLVATAGTNGHPSGRGAESGVSPSRGGDPGPGAFLDAAPNNDFFGVRPVVSGGQLVDLIRGELAGLWAGYGGGGGGNADPANTFPTPSWNFASDEKGGPGGGGGGGLRVKALGRIIFGPSGEIKANGGFGGTGENTNFLDHVGGTGGGGSGGHVILESATLIDFTDGGSNTGGPLRDWIQACGPPVKTGPLQYVDPKSHGYSNGGAGGGGVVQLHVPDSLSPPGTNPATSDIVVPLLAAASPNPLDSVMSPPGFAMIPTFGARSQARSRWISIGEADQQTSCVPALVSFLFGGLETAPGPDEGKILTSGSAVTELAPLLDENLEGSSTIKILPDEVTLALRGAALDPFRTGSSSGISNDIYLRTPALLHDFVLRIDLVEDPLITQGFRVASAVYDEGRISLGDEELRVTVTEGGVGTLQDFFDAIVRLGTVRCRLIPSFVRVVTGGVENRLPSTSFVRLRFQAAEDDGLGNPDEANPLVDWTGDITSFNALPPGALQFFRFEVEFDLDAQGMGLSAGTEPVTLDFLRVPFVF